MNLSRRQFLARSARLGLVLGGGIPLLQACGSSGSSAGAATNSIADGLVPEKGPLRIFNYADYVNPDVIGDFEAKYGIDVEITTFDTDAEAITKLASGAVKVDLHHSMSPSTIGRLIEGGLIQPLNHSYVPNMANVQAALRDPFYDRGSAYSLPYTLFTTGIGYRADRIDPADVEAQGWDLIWNPTYKGQISILDDYREAPALAMLRAGEIDVNTADPAALARAMASLTELVDLVTVKVNIEAYKDIPEGVTTVAHTWSADMLNGANGYLPDGVGPEVLGYWFPADNHGMVGNDCMGVVAGAEHPVLAHLYINELLDNAVAEKNFSWTGYLPALTALDAEYLVAQGYVPDNLRSCVPTNEQIASALRFTPLDLDTDLAWEDAWSRFTAGG